jgi:hypothetical protein
MKVRFLLIGVVVLFIACVLTTSSYAKIDLKTCVGMWLFDEGQGDIVKDSSGNGNDGKLIKGPKWVDGKFGKALEFDGAATYVQIPDAPSLTTPTGITVEVWLKPALLTNIKGFVNKHVAGQATGGDWTLRDYDSGQTGVCFFPYGGTTTKRNELYVNGVKTANPSPAGTLEIGKWVHLAGVWEGSGGFAGNKNAVGIGYMENPAAPAWIFKGLIDEVAIFNVALQEEDIQATVNQGLGKALGIAAVSPSSKLAATWASIKAQ